METSPMLRYFLAGQIRREYILTAEGKACLDIPGGNVLYAASGVAIWEPLAGILSRISSDFPDEWINRIAKKGLDVNGLLRANLCYPMNSLFAYRTPTTFTEETPLSVFTRLGLSYPKSLLEFPVNTQGGSTINYQEAEIIRTDEIPEAYLDASAVHICPMNELNQIHLPYAFRNAHVTTITLDPSTSLMNPNSLTKIKNLTHSITAFLTSEEKLRKLYSGSSTDLWEMAEDICSNGCEITVIKRGALGQLLYTAGNRNRWLIPAYPTRVVDVTGAGDTFCGGFLVGFRNTYDPLEAVLYGNTSSSFNLEGSGAFYAMDILPSLAQARLDTIRHTVRQV